MHHPTDRIAHTTAFVTPVVEHWLEREIAQWIRPMRDRSDDPSHHKRTLLPRSYISLLSNTNGVVGKRNQYQYTATERTNKKYKRQTSKTLTITSPQNTQTNGKIEVFRTKLSATICILLQDTS